MKADEKIKRDNGDVTGDYSDYLDITLEEQVSKLAPLEQVIIKQEKLDEKEQLTIKQEQQSTVKASAIKEINRWISQEK